jgi:TRAP-type C4-dicarboxylate transport system substrate-binding protein
VKDKGQAGIGPSLMVAVARGNISAGLVSMSNLTPVAPELDVLNIPFWSSDNQSYINLVTSDIWKSLVLEKIKANGKIQVLYHYAVGPRTATTVKSYGKLIKIPADVRGLQFRVPASKVLAQFYDMAGASPRKIAWGKAAEAARRNMYAALDPGLIGLYNGPDNLKDQLYAVSRIQSVQDGWAAVISQSWLNSLPKDLQEIVYQASDKTFREQIKKAEQITDACIKVFELAGTTVYMPTSDEKQQWIDQCGYSRKEWDPIKAKILGDSTLFEQLLAATKVNNGYTI